MIILISGATHAGKTPLSRRLRNNAIPSYCNEEFPDSLSESFFICGNGFRRQKRKRVSNLSTLGFYLHLRVYILGRTNYNFLMDNRLRELRKSKGLSQKKLGKLLFVSTSCVSHYENSHRNIPNDYLKRCAEFFDVSIDFLLSARDEKHDDLNTAVLINVIRRVDVKKFTPEEVAEFAQRIKETASRIQSRHDDNK